MLKVCEQFTGIQGESSFAGRLFQFIRLTGCNLRCSYCDTPYAYDEGENTSVEEVLFRIRQVPVRHVLITGGEPLLQPETPMLAQRLLESGAVVLVETNGSLDIGSLPRDTIRIMDFKCPSSGESSGNRLENIDLLTDRDEVKFVIGDRNDYQWARKMVADHKLASRCAVLFSPVFSVLAPRVLAEWMIDDRLPARFNLQLHKILWPDRERGV